VKWGRSLSLGCLLALVVLVGTAAASDELTRPVEGHFHSPCRTGVVRLGHRPGHLVFVVHCVRHHGRKFSFALSRGGRRGESTTISSLTRKPSTRGPGAVYSHGRCQRRRAWVDCFGSADGRVTLRGWLAVPAEGQCGSELAIWQGVSSRCDSRKGEACPTAYVDSQIYLGLPKGC